ncbi:MAG: hypothetical protein HC845_08105 [Akkermansiaceae bacterium]|nr:hypothetical protein [Akkermansiaceae bacterium]
MPSSHLLAVSSSARRKTRSSFASGNPSASSKIRIYFRLPAPLERVVRIDRRLQHADIRLSETLTKDQRNVIVPVFFTWKVADPLRFHISVKDAANASGKLDALITSARNSVLGRHPFSDLVAAEGRNSMLPELEKEMLSLAATDARENLGIQLLSTGITQIQLPEANTESVFRRMRAERKREATQIPRRRPRQSRRNESPNRQGSDRDDRQRQTPSRGNSRQSRSGSRRSLCQSPRRIPGILPLSPRAPKPPHCRGQEYYRRSRYQHRSIPLAQGNRSHAA